MTDEFDPTRTAKPGKKAGAAKSAATKKVQTQAGRKAVRAIFLDAQQEIDEAAQLKSAPDPNLARTDPGSGDAIMPGKWPGFPDNAMPPYLKARIIGRDQDGVVYAVTSTGHLRGMTKFDDNTLADLFAPLTNDAMHAWPAWSKEKKVQNEHGETETVPPKVVRLETKTCARAIINEAARLPDFDPQQQHRGRGGWQNKAGSFIWHSGRYLWTVDRGQMKKADPTMYDGFLYTRQHTTIQPWQTSVKPEESPALRILEDLRTWKWARPYLDPILCLGWLVTALMGGALKARPIVFTTGGAGVGKSTLQELIKTVLEGAVFSTVDTTAAGIYQRVKQDCLPIMVDELESKAGSNKAQNVIELARVAYTGGDIARGGADHEGTTFKMHNSFFLSAINPPPMKTQDKTRMAVLNLSRLDKRDGIGRKINVSQDTDGRMILRQIMDGWETFQTCTMQYYWDILQEQGLDSRAIDTYGTLLAAAELVCGTLPLEQAGLPVASPRELGEMINAATALERAERVEEWHACLSHLLQSTINNWQSGVKPTVGGVLEEVMKDYSGSGHAQLELNQARERLQAVNLGLKEQDEQGRGPFLAVPKDGPELQRIYAGKDWHQSVWWDALQNGPADIVLRGLKNKQKVKINGDTKHCLLIDMQAYHRYCDALGVDPIESE